MSDAATPESRLAASGLVLPTSVPPVGNYARAARVGTLLFVSGHLPDSGAEPIHLGRLGRNLTTSEGYAAARQAAVNMLATIRAATGSLDHVDAVVKLLGMVCCTEDFAEQPQVINGASDLLHEIFGTPAVHARSAVGMMALPRGNCVEIEAILELSAEGAETAPRVTAASLG